MIGKMFNNRYQIIEKLGAGGTAIVYRGQDMLLNRMVTIKILREEFASNQDLVRRFRHEAQAIASLSHPNIVSVYDVGFEENMHYIVMEFVEGESLKEYIKRKGALKLAEACNIITQILAGVQHAHEHGIIHRDIKPHNILLGRDGRAKVTDFGIAVGMSEVTLTYNTTSRIMGSVHYISPEQVQGMTVTEKSDIYSVGAVFYEMLTGRVPFVGETPISIAMQHVQGELLLAHQINPQVPMGISYVVMRAMRKNPETRYASASEMAEAVRAAYQGLLEGVAEEAVEPESSTLPPVPKKKKVLPDGEPAFEENRAAGRRLNAGRIALFAAAALLVVAIILVAKNLAAYLNVEEDMAIVPHLVGMTQTQAETALAEQGLVADITTKTSDTVEEGLVISQNVSPDQEVSLGRVISIVVSAGKEKITLPNFVGSSQRIAEFKLNDLGLPFNITTDYSEEIAKDIVIMQSPEGGSKVEPGTTIDLLISLGKEPEKFYMIDLVGMTMEEARAYIEEKGLVLVSETPTTSYEYESGKVTAQSIGPGIETETNASIELVYSSGPGPTVKTYAYSYHIEQDYNEEEEPVEIIHDVVVSVTDSHGSREVFNQQLAGDSYVNCIVEYYNNGIITLTIDGAIIQTVPVE